MEVESRKDEKEKKRLDALNKAKERMQPVETYFKSLKYKIESGWKVKKGIFSSPGPISSPKRKLMSLEPSPGKKRKLNFTGNLSFWRNMEGGYMHVDQSAWDNKIRCA